jgi:hypothetical protein
VTAELLPTTAAIRVSVSSASAYAESVGLQLGGNGIPFSGDFGRKGLYSYRSGPYTGMAFFGTGGSEAEETALFDDGNKHRVDALPLVSRLGQAPGIAPVLLAPDPGAKAAKNYVTKGRKSHLESGKFASGREGDGLFLSEDADGDDAPVDARVSTSCC